MFQMAQKLPLLPKEILGYFLLQSDATVTELVRFLNTFDTIKCNNIINSHLEQFHNRTSVHLAALRGQAPFLQILLENGGEIKRKIRVNKKFNFFSCHIKVCKYKGPWFFVF